MLTQEIFVERLMRLKNEFTDSFGNRLVNVHHENDQCLEFGCPVHSPSDHPMKDWLLLWRDDRGIFERIDSSGVGHPDPDTIGFIRRTRGEEAAGMESIHGCNGKCKGAYK